MFLSCCSPRSSKARSSRPAAIFLQARRYTDPAGLGQAFEPCRDIHTIAKDVAILDDDISNVDPDAELDAAVWRQRGIAIGQRCLQLGRATQRVDDAGEPDQKAVPGRFD